MYVRGAERVSDLVADAEPDGSNFEWQSAPDILIAQRTRYGDPDGASKNKASTIDCDRMSLQHDCRDPDLDKRMSQ